MRAVLLVLALLAPLRSIAADDLDKRLHFAVSAGMGVVASGMARDPYAAWGVCMVPGTVKELTDRQMGGQPSLKDLAADGLGCAVGVKLGRFVASHSRGRTSVAWSSEF